MTTEEKSKIVHVAEYILNRLKEPSSWAGIALFIGMFGVSPDTIDKVTNNLPAIITALGALIAILAPSGNTKALAVANEARDISKTTADIVGPPASTTAEAIIAQSEG
jgi:hypothetical protein